MRRACAAVVLWICGTRKRWNQSKPSTMTRRSHNLKKQESIIKRIEGESKAGLFGLIASLRMHILSLIKASISAKEMNLGLIVSNLNA